MTNNDAGAALIRPAARPIRVACSGSEGIYADNLPAWQAVETIRAAVKEVEAEWPAVLGPSAHPAPSRMICINEVS